MTDTYLRFEKTRELPDETIPCAKLITADRITGSHEMSKPGGDSQKFYAFFSQQFLSDESIPPRFFQLML